MVSLETPTQVNQRVFTLIPEIKHHPILCAHTCHLSSGSTQWPLLGQWWTWSKTWRQVRKGSQNYQLRAPLRLYTPWRNLNGTHQKTCGPSLILISFSPTYGVRNAFEFLWSGEMSFHRSWRQDDFCQWYLPKRYIQIFDIYVSNMGPDDTRIRILGDFRGAG